VKGRGGVSTKRGRRKEGRQGGEDEEDENNKEERQRQQKQQEAEEATSPRLRSAVIHTSVPPGTCTEERKPDSDKSRQ